jgi:hypothetical protein
MLILCRQYTVLLVLALFNKKAILLCFLLTSYFTSDYNFELKIRPDIRYPAFRLPDIWLAGYPAKSVSGAYLVT